MARHRMCSSNSVWRTYGMGCIICEPCYKGTILQRNYRKMTILWSVSYNSFVKFLCKKNWETQHDHVISKSVLYQGGE